MATSGFARKATEQRDATGLSPRAFYRLSSSESWRLIWEAGPYYERVAEAMEQAHSYAIFVGWQIDSRLELTVSRRETFRQFVVRLCRQKPDFHVYLLMWDYAYFYFFEREMLQSWVWDNVHERVHFIFDNCHPYGGSHHEKFVIVDGETAFVGGVDICDDRWDSPGHLYRDPRRSLRHDGEEHLPYHDLSVEVRGEVAADLVEYIGERWRRLSVIPFPERPRIALAEGRGRYRVLVSRTRASVEIRRPMLVRETEFLYRELIRSARRQLIVENQYYWSREINDELIAVMRARRGTNFRIFLVVPSVYGGSLAFRMMGIVQTALLDELSAVARETRTRLVLGCPFSRGASGEKSVYVHSKVLAVDDRYLAIGSSNFNNRGFRLDTELTLTLLGDSDEARARVRELSEKIVEHWGSDGLYLKSYRPSWSGYFRTLEAWFARHLPVHRVFDPAIPVAYLLKKRLAVGSPARIRRVVPMVLWGLLLLLLGLALVCTALGAWVLGWPAATWVPTGSAQLIPMLTCALFLGASWLVPAATLLSAVCAGLMLGARRAGLLVFCSLLVSATAGYLFARVFPSLALRLCGAVSRKRLTARLGLRRLPALIRIVINPSTRFQHKILYQGILSIPPRSFFVSAALLASIHSAVAAVAGHWGFARGDWVLYAVYVALTLGGIGLRMAR